MPKVRFFFLIVLSSIPLGEHILNFLKPPTILGKIVSLKNVWVVNIGRRNKWGFYETKQQFPDTLNFKNWWHLG